MPLAALSLLGCAQGPGIRLEHRQQLARKADALSGVHGGDLFIVQRQHLGLPAGEDRMGIVTDGVDFPPAILVPSHQEGALIGYLLDELCLGLRVCREVPTMHLGLHHLLDVLSRDLHPSVALGGSLEQRCGPPRTAWKS
jgi:hypothetical protein